MKLYINLIIVFFFALTAANAVDFNEFNRCFINAAEAAKKSVVTINVYKSSSDKEIKSLNKTGYGSGIIISSKGYIITNYHVLKRGDVFQVILFNGKECTAQKFANSKLAIVDEKTDIALIKINSDDIADIEPVNFADSNDLREGEWVIAIGNPYGLRQSVTCGIVSSTGRNDIGFADIEDFIQTDVPINPGNSGGPLINLEGKLVGINTAIRTISGGYQGISFAIPSNIAKQVFSELLQYGRVRRGWLGFLAKERKLPGKTNTVVEVISVIKNSPAEKSGIKKNDIIKEIDGKDISTLGELIKTVSNKPVDTDLIIKISKDGKISEYTLTLREKEVHEKINQRLEKIYDDYGIELDRNSKTGDVVISYISPMGIAYQSGLKKGDIIKAINGKDIFTLDDLIKIASIKNYVINKIEIFRDSEIYSFDILNDNE